MSDLMESLSTMVGGRRRRSRRSNRRSRKHSRRHSRKHGGSCPLQQSAGKRRRRRHSRRHLRKSGGASECFSLNAAPVSGGKRRRSRRHKKKRGGSQLVPLGLLGALLSVGKKGTRKGMRRKTARRAYKK